MQGPPWQAPPAPRPAHTPASAATNTAGCPPSSISTAAQTAMGRQQRQNRAPALPKGCPRPAAKFQSNGPGLFWAVRLFPHRGPGPPRDGLNKGNPSLSSFETDGPRPPARGQGTACGRGFCTRCAGEGVRSFGLKSAARRARGLHTSPFAAAMACATCAASSCCAVRPSPAVSTGGRIVMLTCAGFIKL